MLKRRLAQHLALPRRSQLNEEEKLSTVLQKISGATAVNEGSFTAGTPLSFPMNLEGTLADR